MRHHAAWKKIAFAPDREESRKEIREQSNAGRGVRSLLDI